MRPSPGSKSKARKGQHGDPIGGLPGQPSIVTHGGGDSGKKVIKGPGANASVKKGAIRGGK